MAVPAHLTINVGGLAIDSLLSDWRWLIRTNYTPILMTAFGDLFLRDEAGHVHFLDLMSGELKQVATSQEEFDRLCADKEQRRRYFVGFLVMEFKKLHGSLAVGECYGCKTPLSLDGQLQADNFERVDLQAHYSVLGQLHRQTKHLPAGTKVDGIMVEPPLWKTKPKSWWQRLTGR